MTEITVLHSYSEFSFRYSIAKVSQQKAIQYLFLSAAFLDNCSSCQFEERSNFFSWSSYEMSVVRRRKQLKTRTKWDLDVCFCSWLSLQAWNENASHPNSAQIPPFPSQPLLKCQLERCPPPHTHTLSMLRWRERWGKGCTGTLAVSTYPSNGC